MRYKELVRSLKDILAHMSGEEVALDDLLQSMFVYVSGDRSIHFDPQGVEAFDRFVAEVHKDDVIRCKVGKSILESELFNLLIRLHDDPLPEDRQLDVVVRGYVDSVKQLIKPWDGYIPVEGLRLTVPQITVGKVTFRPYEVMGYQLVDRIKSVFQSQRAASDKTATGMETFVEHMSRQFGPSETIAEVRVQAASSMVWQCVDAEVSAALNLLGCFSYFLLQKGQRPRIGLRGMIAGGTRPYLYFEGSGGNVGIGTSGGNALQPFELGQTEAERLLDDRPFQILSGILAKTEPSVTKMEHLLIRAVRWIGEGVVASSREDQVLHFGVALELLMTAGQQEYDLGSISDRIARRLAFLLSDKRNERLDTYRKAKNLYGLRSTVAHGREAEITFSQVDELQRYAIRALVAMSEHAHEWKCHEDFVNWVQDEQFR